jgi:ribonuclease D
MLHMQATQIDNSPGIWLNETGQLAHYSSQWSDVAAIALDTEFIRERTFWPKLALAQIGVPGTILLADTLAPGMPESLAGLLSNRSQLKLMHSASEDLVALHHACGALPAPLFDTQIAAALAGLGPGLSYQALIRELIGVEVDKGETRSDWMRRPLSPAQLCYASDDVRYLHEAHRLLSDRLARLGRAQWVEQDCQRMLANPPGGLDPWPHLALRSSQSLDRTCQVRLCALLRWRDAHAIHADRPRSWILANDLAVELARRPPDSAEALGHLLNARPNAPRKLRDPIWTALNDPLPDAASLPLAEPQTNAFKQQLKRMQEAVSTVAEKLAIAPTVLASRRHLESLLAFGQWPDALAGWRRELLESELMPFLRAGG